MNATEQDTIANVRVTIIVLIGVLAIAYLGVENIPVGIAISADAAENVWRGFVQIVHAALFYDVVSGPLAEDSATLDVVFTIHEWIAPDR